MTWLEEISSRDHTSPAALLGTEEIQEVLAASLGRGDRLKRLKTVLRGKRYPRLVALEKALEAEVQALGLGDAVRIRFPRALEGNEITVELSARQPGALRAAVGRLNEAVSEGRFDRMFQLLDEAS
jgi:hypothetical protein